MPVAASLDPAPRARRLGGRVVDLVVAGWVLAFAAIEIDGRLLGGDVLARRPLEAVTPEGTRLAVITALVIVALEIVPTALWGRTPGKVMLGLRCVDVDTGGPPGVIRSVFRGLLLHAWVAIPVLGWVLPAAITVTTVFAPSGRGVHDRLSGSIVVDAAGPDEVSP
ncbi:MAG: RDD family protein [Acidimicrobiales bacterium]|nr:RDD family protein [Acidimicrobiales bacterium]